LANDARVHDQFQIKRKDAIMPNVNQRRTEFTERIHPGKPVSVRLGNLVNGSNWKYEDEAKPLPV
jgi:hypothetical protein